MDKKTKGVLVATAAIAGLSTGLLANIKYDAKDGLKIGKSPVAIGVNKASAQSNCNCCNDSGSGACAGR